MTIIGWRWYRALTSAAFDSMEDPPAQRVVEIPGATSDTYTPTAADNGIGYFLEAEVRFIYKHSYKPAHARRGIGGRLEVSMSEKVVSENAIQAAPGTSMEPTCSRPRL